jgi:tRNA pseudouridine synthase 9
MAVTTTTYETHPFPLLDTEKPPPPPPPPDVAITPCDPWPRPYYLSDGLRRVAPYHFTYNTFCKQRWRGREILDVFASEFRDRPREYYRTAIESGEIVINGKPCEDVHTVIKNGDVISHTLHRHEPPVTAQPIGVVSETDSTIVIDKPAGVPVHPAGRYNYNSVIEIMRAERHYAFNPLPCNRLDRLTSGVMFIGKTKAEAEAISEKLRGRTVRKEYVARVKGRFPDGEGSTGDEMKGGVVTCEESILQISPILGLNRARASGKSAKTLFRRIAYYPPKQKPSSSSTPSQTPSLSNDPSAASTPSDPTNSFAAPPPAPATEDKGYSIVHCLPLTGRTHQIRVHLQFLGHPISNDPIYSNRRVFGPGLAQHDSSPAHDAAIIERLSKMGKTETFADAVDFDPSAAERAPMVDQTQQIAVPRNNLLKPLNAGTLHAGSLTPADEAGENPMYTQAEFGEFVKAHDEMVKDYNKRKGEKMTGEKCDICGTDLYSDPGPQELGIYLHALAYGDIEGKWRYQSPMPGWALPPDGFEGPREMGEWEYDGSEVLDFEEKEWGRVKNGEGMRRNKAKPGGGGFGR